VLIRFKKVEWFKYHIFFETLGVLALMISVKTTLHLYFPTQDVTKDMGKE